VEKKGNFEILLGKSWIYLVLRGIKRRKGRKGERVGERKGKRREKKEGKRLSRLSKVKKK